MFLLKDSRFVCIKAEGTWLAALTIKFSKAFD